MEEEYTRSVKQSILDYVLLDPAEQRRLGLTMPQLVSWGMFRNNNVTFIIRGVFSKS